MTRVILAEPLIDPGLMLALGVGLIVFVAMSWLWRRNRDRQPEQRAMERDTASNLRQQSAMREDLQTLMLELEDLSRRIGAQIDTRFSKLDSVIADADERIAALERLLRSARGQPTLDVTVGDEAAAQPAATDAPAEPDAPQPKVKKRKASKKAGAPPPPSENDRQHSRIFWLADQGKDPVEIAKATGSKPGEVELILALRDGAAPDSNES